ncbi:hypothetical protein [Thermoflexus sp.]|uniref:hypothetical protein n=1 Tax=Thermoflexus sp. TaxID=1969742 RepID=UPI0025F5A082|nr:hypothetical protein [Thermoflexus sp.]MDW8179765.1 hypothetical protein [Anaerolineae bacterium]MCS6963505.1 hypothetical protein [Thermoflexus sp.]MCS7350314.1 hypothetical protein [Thermoflexus sp.]MCX7689639.1 hypothetical protein [Thermoflexus sp.]MDW8184785.1 hypothetical protein [Anaerolineae bacterium]
MQPQMEMELAQTRQTVLWLEQERRKDKEMIALLQQRVDQLTLLLEQAREQIRQLVEALAAVQAQAARSTQVEPLLARLREELTAMLDRRLGELERQFRESQTALQLQVNDFQRSLQVLPEFALRLERTEQELASRRAEQDRLLRQLQVQSQRVEEIGRALEETRPRLTYLEEQTRQTAKRVSDVEQGQTDQRKRIEELVQRFPSLEEEMRKLPRRLEPIEVRLEELEGHVEALRLADLQHGQAFRRLEQHVEERLARIEDYHTALHQLQDLARDSRQALEELRTLREGWEHRLKEMGELLRLSEVRLKQEWEEWHTAQEKRFHQQGLIYMERWAEHDREHRSLESRLEHVERQWPRLEQILRGLLEEQEEWARHLRDAARSWGQNHEQRMNRLKQSLREAPGGEAHKL